MTRGNRKEKIVAVFLALTFVVTSFFYVSQPARVFAQLLIPTQVTTPIVPGAPAFIADLPTAAVVAKPTLVIGDLWGSFLQGVIKAGESAGYTILRKYMRKALQNLTKDVWKKLLTGGKGQEEVFQTEPWKDFWEEAGNEAVGSAIEGFAQGFQNEYEFSKQKKAVVQDLEIEAELEEEKGTFENLGGSSIGPELRAIDTAEDNALNTIELHACSTQYTGYYITDPTTGARDNSDAERSALCKKYTDKYNKLGSARTQLENKKKETDKKDADLIAGNTGALSEASRTFVDIVCKPEPDIAFKIFLGLGDQIELTKRKAICPLDTLTKNWQEVVTNTGAKLDEASLQGWNALAGLVDPGNSDLGVQWKLSVAGRSIKDIAQSLGVTDFGAIASQGGIKNITDYSGKTTTPAGVVRSLAENSLKVQIEEDTRFIPTGHLLADLILTAGSTVLSTSLDILTEGLRKKQAIARNSRKSVTGEAFAKMAGRNEDLYDPSKNPHFGGVEAAEARLADFSRLDLSTPKDWNVLARLTSDSCPDGVLGGAKGGDIDACVMDDRFADAVKERITVKEAMSRTPPLLNPDGVFGFEIPEKSAPKSPSWQSNFPYRSLVIMRKYRVIPVSWELAALYIKNNPDKARDNCGGGNCTLRILIEKSKDSKSPFYGMIDGNWVLKIPPVLCALRGYGTEYQEQSSTKVNRAPEQCVDYQTCLDEEEGKCNKGRYGYCLQEQKIIRFKGEQCDEQFYGCESFQDTKTKVTAGYLTQSLRQNADLTKGACTVKNAGCQWYSKTRGVMFKNNPRRADLGFDMKAKVSTLNPDTANAIQQEWLSESADKVYFAFSAEMCDANAEGCRAINGPAGTPRYLRFPPPSLECLTDGIKDGVVVPWYKREDCKEYTQLCKAEYKGCQQYMPQGDTIAVTGTEPNRCPLACANIYNYAEQKTLFDESGTDHSSGSVYFNATTAQKCDYAGVGCEEFTNLDAVARGGEGKEYYTYLQRCEQGDPETIPAKEVFYSFVGSDTAGGQPEKYYVKGEGTPGSYDYKPACADGGTACHCTVADQHPNDPRVGEVLCREFINPNGNVFYRWTHQLVYRTSDCTSYRRTLDGAPGLANTYSPQYSRACSAQTVNCREYRAPQAGNVRILPYDNFETIGDLRGWQSISSLDLTTPVISNEGEVLGDHSLKVAKKNASSNVQVLQLGKRLPIQKSKAYQIKFNIKAPAGAKLGKPIIAPVKQKNDSNKIIYLSNNEPVLSGSWQQFQFILRKETLEPYELLDNSLFRITVTKNTASVDPEFYIDDVVIKEFTGIEYLIRDSWTKNGSCFNQKSREDSTPNFKDPAYSNCSLYTDKEGTQHALMSFQRVCPNEMAGCMQVTVKEGKIDGTNLVDSELRYIIPDENKACSKEQNKCTAYGSPKLLTSLAPIPGNPSSIKRSKVDSTTYKEEWNIAYYKITPEEILVTPKKSGICRAIDIGCREYAVGSKGYNTYFRAPGARVCQPPVAGEKNWFYYTCQTSTSIICRQDSDCPVTGGVQEKCNTEKKERCGSYIEAGGQASEFPLTTLVRCPCDKDNDRLECNNASVLPNDPISCKDVFDKGKSSRDIKKDSISSSFVFACPASAVGCRRISDPECTESTKTLRTDYGRGSAGVPCTPAYYFTENLDTRPNKCGNSVNVEEGCLLFNDEAKRTYVYQEDTATSSVPILPVCRCDIDAKKKDCANVSASEFDTETCYDSFDENEKQSFQKYTRKPTGLMYSSKDYYVASRTRGSVNLGSVFYGTKDANVLIKVKQDRQCKTWLKCTGFWKEGEREICFKRDLCDKWGGEGNSCGGSPTTLEGSNGLVTGSATAGAGIVPSLSGIARPDYKFPNAAEYTTEGGYGFNFNLWQQQLENDVDNRSYSTLLMKPDNGVTSFNKQNRKGATDEKKSSIISSCRLYSQQTTGRSTANDIVDACRVEAGSYGIYGYCLEPYPNKDGYYERNNFHRKVCTNITDKDCVSDADCRPGGRCAFRYYENACLTWLPVDRIEAQRNLFTSQTGQELAMYNDATKRDAYYCLDTLEETKSWPHKITYAPPNTVSSEIKVRDSSGAKNQFSGSDCALLYPLQPCASDKNRTIMYDGNLKTPEELNIDGKLILHTFNPFNQPVNDVKNGAGNIETIDALVNEHNYSKWKTYTTSGNTDKLEIDLYPIAYFRNQVGGDTGFGNHEIPKDGTGRSPVVGSEAKYIFNADAQNSDTPLVFKIEKATKSGPASPYDVSVEDSTINNKTDPVSVENVKIFKDGMSRGRVDCAALKADDGSSNEVFRTDDMKDAIYVGLMPDWSMFTAEMSSGPNGPKFNGWKFVICQDPTVFGTLQETVRDGYDDSGAIKWKFTGNYKLRNKSFFAIAFDAHFRYITQYPSQTLAYQYKETICKNFVKVVDNGQAVTNGFMDKVPPGSIGYPIYDGDPADSNTPNAGKPVKYKVEGLGWSGCDGNAETLIKDNQNPTRLKNASGILPGNFSCKKPPNDFEEPLNRIDNQNQSKNIKVLGSLIDPSSNGCNLRDMEPAPSCSPWTSATRGFAKAYEFWAWGIPDKPNVYTKTAVWNGNKFDGLAGGVEGGYNQLINFWNKSKEYGMLYGRPEIYGNTEAEKNQFVVEAFDKNKIEIRFYAKVKENQRPIKDLYIQWDKDTDPDNKLTVAKSTFDGRGVAAKLPPAVKEASDTTFSGYGPFHYEYTKGIFAGKKVCVTIKDNWDAETTTCGTLGDGGSVSKWTSN